MSAKLFVGNLNPKTTVQQLSRFFSSAGFAASVRVPLDRDTGHSRGFAFVEFADVEQAEQAMRVFDGRELGGRLLRVSMAKPDSGFTLRNSRGREAVPELLEDDEFDRSSSRLSSGFDEDPYRDARSRSRRRHRGHGSDRRRSRGTRRYLD